MYTTDEKLIEIACFSHPSEAAIPVSLLESEGIYSFMHNALSTQVMGLADVGGARLQVMESDAERARAILREGGYESSLNTYI
ncbi:MAG: DUF2007 domain-containing protein [Tannerellaceae bacterium]|jgi:hypothetical protein|nr:DUF2007 domain-containing protein [Tannerellaceae bacterium]